MCEKKPVCKFCSTPYRFSRKIEEIVTNLEGVLIDLLDVSSSEQELLAVLESEVDDVNDYLNDNEIHKPAIHNQVLPKGIETAVTLNFKKVNLTCISFFF